MQSAGRKGGCSQARKIMQLFKNRNQLSGNIIFIHSVIIFEKIIIWNYSKIIITEEDTEPHGRKDRGHRKFLKDARLRNAIIIHIIYSRKTIIWNWNCLYYSKLLYQEPRRWL